MTQGFQPYTIDESITQVGAASVQIPDGVYLFEYAGCEPSREDHDGPPFVAHKLRIIDGRKNEGGVVFGVGRALTSIGTMKSGAQFGNGRLLVALGADPSRFQGQNIQTYAQHVALAGMIGKALAGRKVAALVANETINGKPRSSAVEFYPADEFETQARAVNVGVAPAPPARAAAANGAAANVAPPAAPFASEDDLSAKLQGLFADVKL